MGSKKKILHIIQSLDNGGCENMLLRTLPLMTDFEHQILTLKSLGELAPRLSECGIAIENVRCESFFDIPGIIRLTKQVERVQPDIIITYLFHADILGRLVLQNTSQAIVIPFLRTTYNHPRYLIARIFEYLTKPLAKQYLANSEAVKDFYVKSIGVKANKITVIPNGIDVEYFQNLIPSPLLRSSLGIEPDDKILICVANLHINKGHRYLLEAFESLCLKFPRMHLLFVGDGGEKENILTQIQSYQSKPFIHLLGKRTDVPELLSISDIFVLPTLFEGMSNAILEAMASGLPIITTDIPENKILIENRTNGLLVPPCSVDALKKAISTLLEEPEVTQKVSLAARKTLAEEYSLEKIRTLFTQTLEKIS